MNLDDDPELELQRIHATLSSQTFNHALKQVSALFAACSASSGHGSTASLCLRLLRAAKAMLVAQCTAGGDGDIESKLVTVVMRAYDQCKQPPPPQQHQKQQQQQQQQQQQKHDKHEKKHNLHEKPHVDPAFHAFVLEELQLVAGVMKSLTPSQSSSSSAAAAAAAPTLVSAQLVWMPLVTRAMAVFKFVADDTAREHVLHCASALMQTRADVLSADPCTTSSSDSQLASEEDDDDDDDEEDGEVEGEMEEAVEGKKKRKKKENSSVAVPQTDVNGVDPASLLSRGVVCATRLLMQAGVPFNWKLLIRTQLVCKQLDLALSLVTDLKSAPVQLHLVRVLWRKGMAKEADAAATKFKIHDQLPQIRQQIMVRGFFLKKKITWMILYLYFVVTMSLCHYCQNCYSTTYSLFFLFFC